MIHNIYIYKISHKLINFLAILLLTIYTWYSEKSIYIKKLGKIEDCLNSILPQNLINFIWNIFFWRQVSEQASCNFNLKVLHSVYPCNASCISQFFIVTRVRDVSPDVSRTSAIASRRQWRGCDGATSLASKSRRRRQLLRCQVAWRRRRRRRDGAREWRLNGETSASAVTW